MEIRDLSFWGAFKSRNDLEQYGVDSLLLFALQLKFGIEDIHSIASDCVTEGGWDKKTDLIYIDSESEQAVIAQAYMTENILGKDGKPKKEAPSSKASDLNAAATWLLGRPMDGIPIQLQSHALELRQAIKDKKIRRMYFWYVHNLPESTNVKDELITVEHTADAIIKSNFSDCGEIEINAIEVGTSTLEEWHKLISIPILVSEEFTIPITGGFEIGEENWQSYVTSIPAKWLYENFQIYKTDLFSANVREYLGSSKRDNNINNGIKRTANVDPGHFWVFNNGITALVYEYNEKTDVNGEKSIYFKGISVVNGAQTVGAIGNLDELPDERAKVQIRFIKCNDISTVYDIVRFNNSQNKITGPDFRSNDHIQRRLIDEFDSIPGVTYLPRRGGHVDIIKRGPDILPSVTAGQALAAFHGDPDIAYHEKTHMWESDELYSRYFNDRTNARHILFALSLLRSVEKKKTILWNKSKEENLIGSEKEQFEFFRKRGSTYMITSAIAKCLEDMLNKQIPNTFDLTFNTNVSFEDAIDKWSSIVNTASAFTEILVEGLADGFKTRETVDKSTQGFRSLIAATREANDTIYSEFAKQVN